MNYKTLFAALVLSSLTVPALAEPDKEVIQHGKELHNEHCTECHTDQVYTRDDRFIKSMEALHKQVERCKTSKSLTWFDEDTEAVVKFLNEKYYKF